MKIRVEGLEVRSVMDHASLRNPNMDLHYGVRVQFSAEDLQDMQHMRGQQSEQMIDLIGEAIKNEMRRLHHENKREV